MNRDPIGYEGIEWNLYEYVGGMPTTYTDPSGEIAPAIILAIQAFVIAEGLCIIAQGLYCFSRQAALGINDPTAHCWASCLVSRTCGRVPSMLAGYINEIVDEMQRQFGIQNWGWDPVDILMNAEGHECSGWETWIHCGNIGRWFRESCLDCCNAKNLK